MYISQVECAIIANPSRSVTQFLSKQTTVNSTDGALRNVDLYDEYSTLRPASGGVLNLTAPCHYICQRQRCVAFTV